MTLAYPDAPEQFAHHVRVSSFIDGVRDIQLQQALRLGRYAEMYEALAYALAYEDTLAEEAVKLVNCQQRSAYLQFSTVKERLWKYVQEVSSKGCTSETRSP